MEFIVNAQKCSWTERRGETWGTTVYYGLRIQTERGNMLVAKLSHGLRVLPLDDPSKYNFIGSPIIGADVSEEFISEALKALDADKAFQTQLIEYEQVIAS